MSNRASDALFAHWGIANDRVPPEVEAMTEQSLQTDATIENELVLDGRTYVMTYSPVTEDAHVNVYVTDITARKEAEFKLRKAHDELDQRVKERTRNLVEEIERRTRTEQELILAKEQAEYASRAKREFLANMSHELRTPLNAIIGFSELMSSEMLGPVSNPTYTTYLKDINVSGKHLLDLINDILDVSKIEAGKMSFTITDVVPADAVNRALPLVQPHANASDVKLIVTLGDNLPPIRADQRRLVQVITNLLSNAIKFSEEGTTITVEATKRAKGDRVDIVVRDQGIGMSEVEAERAQRPFEQVDSRLERRGEGTGLGLYLAKSFT
ncbi:MAG: PAS domain-containing sensor histidine kinase, partial [Arenibacter algicola]|nr:PAS domain-containing sensor histidine kinase [Arenibacter algicola]